MIEKILCATDGSHSAEKAVGFAASMARQCAVPMDFVVVNTATTEKIESTGGWNSEEWTAAEAQSKHDLDYARRAAEENNVSAGLHEAEGRNIAETIVAFAETNGCNHIVVGSAGRRGLAGILLGSVAQSVVTHAHCPVTVVR